MIKVSNVSTVNFEQINAGWDTSEGLQILQTAISVEVPKVSCRKQHVLKRLKCTELRNCILRIIRVSSLFYSIQVYRSLHFFTYSFGKLFYISALFVFSACFVLNSM